jgi:AcrR family transcriptional regulator
MQTNRERLIGAAKELFWRQGVAVTSPRQVLAESGVGQGSLYHHFPAKHDLALAAIHEAVEESLATARRELSGDLPALDRLRDYLERPRDAVAGCRVGRLTYEQYVVDDTVLSGPVHEYFATLVALVEDAFAQLPHASPETARERAYAAVAVLQGGYVLSRALADPGAMTSAVAGFVDLLTGQAS